MTPHHALYDTTSCTLLGSKWQYIPNVKMPRLKKFRIVSHGLLHHKCSMKNCGTKLDFDQKIEQSQMELSSVLKHGQGHVKGQCSQALRHDHR